MALEMIRNEYSTGDQQHFLIYRLFFFNAVFKIVKTKMLTKIKDLL